MNKLFFSKYLNLLSLCAVTCLAPSTINSDLHHDITENSALEALPVGPANDVAEDLHNYPTEPKKPKKKEKTPVSNLAKDIDYSALLFDHQDTDTIAQTENEDALPLLPPDPEEANKQPATTTQPATPEALPAPATTSQPTTPAPTEIETPGTPTPTPALTPATTTVPETPAATETPTAPTTPAVPTTPAPVPAIPTTPDEPLPPAPAQPTKPAFSTGVETTTGPAADVVHSPPPPESPTINFNNVSIIEYIRFISRLTGKNFIFDENDLQFNVTIISEEPTTLDNVMTALLQELRIHDLTLIEESNDIIIHRNPAVNSLGHVVTPNLPEAHSSNDAELVTRVFQLNTTDAESVALIIRPLVSARAQVDALKDTNHLVVTDLTANVDRIATVIKSIDSPYGGLTLGQYVVRNVPLDVFAELAEKAIKPIAQGQPFYVYMVQPSNSLVIVGSPYIIERTIPILQRLDQLDGVTGIYDPKDLRFEDLEEHRRQQELQMKKAAGIVGPATESTTQGLQEGVKWKLSPDGNWYFQTNANAKDPRYKDGPPRGSWTVDPKGYWFFDEGGTGGQDGPKGRWVINADGIWIYELEGGQSIYASTRVRTSKVNPNVPVGSIERTKFYVHKLMFRKGESVIDAIRNIGISLLDTESVNPELLAALHSVQYLKESNSLIITGIPEAIEQVREMIEEIDVPLQQVFIEMLILEASVADSLEYGVNWGTRFGGGDVAGAQAFLRGGSGLSNALDTTGGSVINGVVTPNVPSANLLATNGGYSLGIVGHHIVHTATGIEFNSIAALVRAVHDKVNTNIVMNPKILAEDGAKAEIFVGLNTAFKTQSIANDRGDIITNNFEFRDVGARLTVTPYIGPNCMITLDIEEEVSSVVSTGTGGTNNNIGSNLNTDQAIGPTTRKSKTRTRVHLPNKYFLILSGMIQDEETIDQNRVPCLGGFPFIGALFRYKKTTDVKRNLMIFIRPQLVDCEEEMQNLTKHQQDIFRIKRASKNSWKYETQEALEWMNIDKYVPGTDLNGWDY